MSYSIKKKLDILQNSKQGFENSLSNETVLGKVSNFGFSRERLEEVLIACFYKEDPQFLEGFGIRVPTKGFYQKKKKKEEEPPVNNPPAQEGSSKEVEKKN